MDDRTYGGDIVDQHWPVDGPHNAHTTEQAGAALAELVRFLNHAVGFHSRSALPGVWVANSTVNYVHSAVAGFPELLEHLAQYMDKRVGDRLIYDDRRHTENPVPPEVTVRNAAAALRKAGAVAQTLADELRLASSHTGHLGTDDAWDSGEDLG